MKTLPEILEDNWTQDPMGGTMSLREGKEAIAKELMGIIGEDEEIAGPPNYLVTIDDVEKNAHNQLRAELRARLTAFMGEIEK